MKTALIKVEFVEETGDINFLLFGEPSPAFDFAQSIMQKVKDEHRIIPTHQQESLLPN